MHRSGAPGNTARAKTNDLQRNLSTGRRDSREALRADCFLPQGCGVATRLWQEVWQGLRPSGLIALQAESITGLPTVTASLRGDRRSECGWKLQNAGENSRSMTTGTIRTSARSGQRKGFLVFKQSNETAATSRRQPGDRGNRESHSHRVSVLPTSVLRIRCQDHPIALN